jgi:hypothetical protein
MARIYAMCHVADVPGCGPRQRRLSTYCIASRMIVWSRLSRQSSFCRTEALLGARVRGGSVPASRTGRRIVCREGATRLIALVSRLLVISAVVGAAVFGYSTASAWGATTVLQEGFEGGAPGWTISGMWHIQDHPEQISVASPGINPDLVTLPDSGSLPSAYDGTHVAWFGEASTGTFCGSDYQTVSQTPKDGCTSSQVESGDLISPPFSLAGAASAEVSFYSWWEIESVNADTFDVMQVDYSTDGGLSWTSAGKLNPVNNPAGQHDQDYTAEGIEQPAQWHHLRR